MLELENKSFCTFGLPDSGKSTLTCYILSQFGASGFVYDTLNEYPSEPFDSYIPKGNYDTVELETVIRLVKKQYRLIVIDEANRFCPSKPAPLPQEVADLNDFRAHYGLAVGYVCRRPVQLNQDLTETAHYLLIFLLRGKNDIDYLNSIAAGLGDTVSQLQPYYFVVVDPLKRYEVYSPIPREFITDKLLVKR